MDISSIDKTEIDKFKNLAKEWWKHDGKFKTLHKFNPVRLEYICLLYTSDAADD